MYPADDLGLRQNRLREVQRGFVRKPLPALLQGASAYRFLERFDRRVMMR